MRPFPCFRRLRGIATGAVLPLLLTAATAESADPDSFDVLAKEYANEVRPLLGRFCLDCHSTEEKEGDLDLEAFAKIEDVRRSPGSWRKVVEMLDGGEMPPKDADQPTAEERGTLRGWTARYLKAEAYANAGDPGPVVLRRLNNAQYTYTLKDLIGLDLQPAREFPADGAAGEGFTNAGNALSMSPAMLGKYLDAAKRIAAHAVLLPDGIRFSPGETRRDWTDELLASIRALYAEYADAEGRLPLEKYLAAALEERRAVGEGRETYVTVARRRGLNARHLAALAALLDGGEPSPLLDPLRARWKTAGPGDAPALAAEVARWQQGLTKFQSVGHMKPWVAAIDPVVTRQDVRFKFPDSPAAREVTIHLTADGPMRPNVVVWENLRIARPGRPEVALRDVRAIAEGMAARREQVVSTAAKCLEAAAEAEAATDPKALDREALARKHGVDPEILGSWLECLGIGTGSTVALDLFTQRLESVGGFDFVNGWGSPETPSIVANGSDRTVNIPGELKGRGVAAHPSPTLRAGVGWLCPTAGGYQVQAEVKHVHTGCGNGTAWRLEMRRGAARLILAEGATAGATPIKAGPFGPIALGSGDLIALVIAPRDGNHACDLTSVDLTVSEAGAGGRSWDLARDVTGDALAANPHADGFGNASVWHAFREPDKDADGLILPPGSLLFRWLSTPGAEEKKAIAEQVQRLLTAGPAGAEAADVALYHHLTSLGGPIVSARPGNGPIPADSTWGLDPVAFGPGAVADGIAPEDLAVRSPSALAVRLPSELVAGAELIGTGIVRPLEGGDDFVQLRISTEAPALAVGLRPDAPVLVTGDPAAARLKAAFDEFRRWFPPALCYEKIVPVDEVVTLTLFHREDEPLRRLMLDESETARLDRLWEELHFISQDALAQVDAFAQLMEYATQDSDPRLFEPFRKPIHEHAEAFRKALVDAEPRQLDALVAFASQAYRRPTTEQEGRDLRDLYARLRVEEIPHDEALRLAMARILVSPNFLYRLEKAPEGTESGPVSDWELANRLSYFLRSSAPDAELREAAASGRLRDPDVLAAQAKRLLRSPDARRLAEEFACQWLHIYDFDAQDEKSERHFPTFSALKGAMYEEAILFFADLFQSDASVLSIYDADHAFLNEALAGHYAIPGVSGPEWRRVDGVRKYGRGGILGLSATLAKQSGASRTSPILRGNWITEVLLGEPTPKPPKDIPLLPDDEEAGGGLSVRQLVEKHTRDVRCAGCHAKMDPYGFSLEAYDAIGRFRERDVSGQPVDARAKVLDGSEFVGGDGLRDYLLTSRRDAIERQFCKKLLGYALGRGVQLSDEPLLDEIQRRLESEQHRVSAAVDAIVRSRQFRELRGAGTVVAEAPDRPRRTRRPFLHPPPRPSRCPMPNPQFSRRTFLRGVGVTMSLPWLESRNVWGLESATVRPASEAPVRVGVLFAGNGFHGKEWWAKGEGKDMELGQVLAPLHDFREKLVFIKGLYNEEALKGNIHSSQTGNLLSGAPLASGGEIRSGTSFDQLLAQSHAGATKVPSLVLGCEQANPSVHKNYSMLYSSHISWSSPTSPTPLELFPALAFDRLFKDEARRGDQSVLDAVLADANDFRRDVSLADRRKLDEYLESVREVEQRIERAGMRGELQGWKPTLAEPNVPRPADGVPQDISEHMRLMCDILVLGFQTDATRVTTLKLNNDHSSLRFPQLGVDYMIHHLLSHADTPDWLKVNQLFTAQLAYIARKLDATQEGERTALDNTMLMLCSSMLSGGTHDATQLPVVLVGGGGGKLQGGRVLDYLKSPNRKMCSLYLSMLDKAGLHLDAFGDSTEPLGEI